MGLFKARVTVELTNTFVRDIPTHLPTSFVAAEGTTQDQAYYDALASDYHMGRAGGIDGALKRFDFDALLLPTSVADTPAAIAGYPIVTGQISSFRWLLL